MRYKAEFIVKPDHKAMDVFSNSPLWCASVFNLCHGATGNTVRTGSFPVIHLNLAWAKKYWPHLTKKLPHNKSRRIRVILSTTELRQSIPVTLISRQCSIQIECGDEGTGDASHIFGRSDSAQYPYFCTIVFSKIFRKISKILKYGNNPMWMAVRRA